MIKEYLENVDLVLKILKEIAGYSDLARTSSVDERRVLLRSIESGKNKIKMINSSLPTLIQQINFAPSLPSMKERESKLEKIEIESKNGGTLRVTLDKKFKQKFLDELLISEENLRKIEKKKSVVIPKELNFRAGRPYLTLSNRLFINWSRKLIKSGKFANLANDLKKSNMDVLFEGYVSMILFTTFWVILVGIVLALFFTIFSYSFTGGLTKYAGNMFVRALVMLSIPVGLGLISFFTMYVYPKTEKRDIEERINHELPFAVVYMSAIAGSGIEPSAIFKIIAFSTEYPYLRKEIRKVLNQINIYGYDLVTALTNVANNSPSKKLSELFSGLTTTITSGGSLPEFFQKRAETLVTEYRLEREKFSKVAETSMDLYITIVIAAPMILLLIFILMSISDFSIGLSPTYLTFMIIGVIAVINVIFLSVLNTKQPEY